MLRGNPEQYHLRVLLEKIPWTLTDMLYIIKRMSTLRLSSFSTPNDPQHQFVLRHTKLFAHLLLSVWMKFTERSSKRNKSLVLTKTKFLPFLLFSAPSLLRLHDIRNNGDQVFKTVPFIIYRRVSFWMTQRSDKGTCIKRYVSWTKGPSFNLP